MRFYRQSLRQHICWLCSRRNLDHLYGRILHPLIDPKVLESVVLRLVTKTLVSEGNGGCRIIENPCRYSELHAKSQKQPLQVDDMLHTLMQRIDRRTRSAPVFAFPVFEPFTLPTLHPLLGTLLRLDFENLGVFVVFVLTFFAVAISSLRRITSTVDLLRLAVIVAISSFRHVTSTVNLKTLALFRPIPLFTPRG